MAPRTNTAETLSTTDLEQDMPVATIRRRLPGWSRSVFNTMQVGESLFVQPAIPAGRAAAATAHNLGYHTGKRFTTRTIYDQANTHPIGVRIWRIA